MSMALAQFEWLSLQISWESILFHVYFHLESFSYLNVIGIHWMVGRMSMWAFNPVDLSFVSWICDHSRCVLSLCVMLFVVWSCSVDPNRLWASKRHNHTSIHHTPHTHGHNFWTTWNHCLALQHTLTHTSTIYLMDKHTSECSPQASLHSQHNLYDECRSMFWPIATTHITHTSLNVPHINSYLYWHHISLSYVTLLKSQF